MATALPPALLQVPLQSLRAKLVDLQRVQLPALATCPGPAPYQTELIDSVKAEISRIRREFADVSALVEDLDKVAEIQSATVVLQELTTLLNTVIKEYREAVLASNKLLSAGDRTELLRATTSNHAPKSPASGEDALMNATSDVTDGLRRTMQLMQQELDQSLTSNEILKSSTQTMQLTTDEYNIFSTLLGTSKALITSLERADLLDRLLLIAALVFFGLCCAFIIKRRVLDKGIKLAAIVARSGKGSAAAVAEREWEQETRHIVQSALAVITSITTALAAATTTMTSSVSVETSTTFSERRGGPRTVEPKVKFERSSRGTGSRKRVAPIDVVESIVPIREDAREAVQPVRVQKEEVVERETVSSIAEAVSTPTASSTSVAVEATAVENLATQEEESPTIAVVPTPSPLTTPLSVPSHEASVEEEPVEELGVEDAPAEVESEEVAFPTSVKSETIEEQHVPAPAETAVEEDVVEESEEQLVIEERIEEEEVPEVPAPSAEPEQIATDTLLALETPSASVPSVVLGMEAEEENQPEAVSSEQHQPTPVPSVLATQSESLLPPSSSAGIAVSASAVSDEEDAIVEEDEATFETPEHFSVTEELATPTTTPILSTPSDSAPTITATPNLVEVVEEGESVLADLVPEPEQKDEILTEPDVLDTTSTATTLEPEGLSSPAVTVVPIIAAVADEESPAEEDGDEAAPLTAEEEAEEEMRYKLAELFVREDETELDPNLFYFDDEDYEGAPEVSTGTSEIQAAQRAREKDAEREERLRDEL